MVTREKLNKWLWGMHPVVAWDKYGAIRIRAEQCDIPDARIEYIVCDAEGKVIDSGIDTPGNVTDIIFELVGYVDEVTGKEVVYAIWESLDWER